MYSTIQATIGITLFDGYWGQLRGLEGKKRFAVKALDSAPASYQDMTGMPIDPSLFTPLYNVFTDYGTGFAKIQAVAFELAIPDGKYTFKLDYLKILNPIPKSYQVLNSIYNSEDFAFLYGLPACASLFSAVNNKAMPNAFQGCASASIEDRKLYEYLFNKNKGILDRPVSIDIAIIGFDYIGESWNTIFGLVLYQLTNHDLKLDSFYTNPIDHPETHISKKYERSVFPIFATQYKFGSDLEESFGGLLYFDQTIKFEISIGLFYKNRISESISMTFFTAFSQQEFGFSQIFLPALGQIEKTAKNYGYKQEDLRSVEINTYFNAFSNEGSSDKRDVIFNYSVVFSY